jgi:hypothetical protein
MQYLLAFRLHNYKYYKQREVMEKLSILMSLLIISSAALAQDTIIDYINVESLCKNLELTVEQSSCSSGIKINNTHDILINRVDPISSDVELIQTQISESQLVKVCDELNNTSSSEGTEKILSMDIDVESTEKAKRKWKISFTFGPFMSFHKKLNMRLRNSDTDVVISNLGPVQRTSFRYYAFWRGENGALQFIDEPQNDITIEVANDKMFFGIRYSHPKTLFQDIHDNPQINHNIGIKGKIGGTEVNEEDVNLNKYIHTLSTSHGNTNINLFGGRRFIFAGKEEGNNLEFRLGVGAGVSIANGVSKYYRLNDKDERELEVTEYRGIKVYGFNITGESTLRYNFMQGKMNASINTRGLYTRIDGPIGNFRATGNLFTGQTGISIGYSPGFLKTKEERKIAKLKKQERAEEQDKLLSKRELAELN